jgi:hypothetical protein
MAEEEEVRVSRPVSVGRIFRGSGTLAHLEARERRQPQSTKVEQP